MHTDEDGTALPISLARPKLLANTGGTHTHMYCILYAQTYTWANRRRAYEHCFIFFSKVSNVIFVTQTAISEAVLDEAFAQLNIEVFTDINMSKRLLKEIARERHHTIETREYIYFWKAKKALCLWLFAAKYSVQLCKGIGSWRHWKMLISSDLMHG